jgi:hypothetical protein
MNRPIIRFLRLDGAERALFMRAVALTASARALLPVLGFARARATLERIARRIGVVNGTLSPSDTDFVLAVRRASRRVPGSDTCLYRALVLDCWLRTVGYSTELHVAFARRGRPTPHGHAWVTSAGRVLIGEEDELALEGVAGTRVPMDQRRR